MENFDLSPIETLMKSSIDKLDDLLSKMKRDFDDKEKEYKDKIESLENDVYDLTEKLNNQ